MGAVSFVNGRDLGLKGVFSLSHAYVIAMLLCIIFGFLCLLLSFLGDTSGLLDFFQFLF